MCRLRLASFSKSGCLDHLKMRGVQVHEIWTFAEPKQAASSEIYVQMSTICSGRAEIENQIKEG